jgi:hypothetical protein
MMNYGLTAASTGALGRTYQYFTGEPTYPFGYGLSYSSFGISHVTADRRSAVSIDRGADRVGCPSYRPNKRRKASVTKA